MAHLRRFLPSTILFSSISPNYELSLKEELYGCFKYIGIPLKELYNMPTRDRQFFIAKHNEAMENMNKTFKKEKNTKSVTGESINAYAELEQERLRNEKRG